MKKNNERHLSPEELVDLLEGAPVDAAAKQHYSGCARCTREVSQMRETVTELRGAELAEPGAKYWKDFNARLRGADLDRRKTRRWYGYAAAAAAVILVISSWQLGRLTAPQPVEPSSFEAVLPSIEEDPGFLFLLSVVELADLEEGTEESLEWGAFLDFDPYLLTPEEQERLGQELEQEMKEDHAAS